MSFMTEITVFQLEAAAKGASVKPVFMVIRGANGALVEV